tara:strand:- start:213 stop:521 length:309 start_codon:yes stop_codon:yes gene_type:complete
MCTDECTSTTCESPRTLPWAQDFDDGLNCTDLNTDLCYPDDTISDVWDLWDVTLRDLVILDRQGNYITRINLTYNNIDPDGIGSCSGNYETLKNLILTIRDM